MDGRINSDIEQINHKTCVSICDAIGERLQQSLRPDTELPPRWRIGSLAQEAPDGPESLINVVLKADLERDALLHEAETADDPHRIAEIQMRLVDIDAHSAPARAAAILSGLGFSTVDQAQP